ncbi:sensor histidine kinase [Cohnella herbarum]|uniref:Sensor histidine kinase n=1 Tax=Cohnella herbarum TaxID=2728023 RepID=A0A7Z2VRI1_9BACL|nr:sensor histidine kinase [Cohnella herbarum]QJD87868.1 sensor histidine kinase [Cohnella herbarum]
MIKKLLSMYRKKVFYKIFLLLLLATSIPTVILTTMSHESTRRLFQSDFIEYKKTLNNQIVNSIDENLQTMQKQSEALAYNILDIQRFLSYKPTTIDEGYFEAANRVNYFLTSILSNNDRFDGIGLLSLNGSIATYVNADGFTPQENSKIRIPGVEDTLINNGGPVITMMDLDQTMNSSIRNHKNNNVIGVLRTLLDYKIENKPIGISLFTQELSKFGEIVTHSRITEEDTVIILSDNNKVVFSNREQSPDSLQQLIERAEQERADKTNEQISFNWKDQFIIYDDSSIFEFKVITSVHRHVIEEKMSVVKRINFLLMTVLVISTIILSILLSNLITSPLIRLKKSFIQFQRGNFSVMIEAKGADEFAEIALGFNTMAENVHHLIKEKYEIELARRQSELESLQSKINPHFLYNTLSSIKAVIRDENAGLARQMVQHLSDLFRYSLNRGRFIVTLVEELDHVNKYLTLQKLRFGEQFRMTFDIDDELLSTSILRLTLQPIVENAILHGLENKTGHRLVHICAQTYDNELWIYIEDNGKGMDSRQADKMNAMLGDNPRTMLDSPTRDRVGIYNVNSRIKLYYGNEYGISILSAPDEGTIVKIILPLDRGTQL